MDYTLIVSGKKIILMFAIIVLFYFVYHIYNGERGLIAKKNLEIEYTKLKQEHDTLKQERKNLQDKINSLGAGDGQIDSDLLMEHLKKIGFIHPDEIVITN